MFQVKCPKCQEVRLVRAKKPWMKGEPPFEKDCKTCCQVGKEKTEEHKEKLSESMKALQTDEVLARKSKQRKDHPEVWQDCLVPGAGGGWNKGLKGVKKKGK